jgi:predicted amidohydrolase
MHMRKFALAGLQLDVDAGDNLARIAREVAAAKKRFPWLDMIVLPELCAYGPSIAHAEPGAGPAEQAFRRMARDNGVWLLPGSLFQLEGERIFNVTPVIDPAGEIVSRYRKIFPFRPYEQGVAAGDALCTFSVPGVGKFGVSICYDLWFPEITRSLAWLGAEVVLCPSLTNTIDRDVELAMARAGAAGNQCYLVNVNAGAPMGMGKSIVCGPGGEVMHQASSGYEVFAVEIDLEVVAHVRRSGWHGLGQPLKSLRDSGMSFPPYQPGAQSDALAALGPLTKPNSARSPQK